MIHVLLGLILSVANVSASESSLSWNGDFRYRGEYVDQPNTVPEKYFQHRIRARLGAKAQVNDKTEVQARLATATGRTSTNQTLGGSNNAYQNYGITIDRAFFTTKPVSELTISGGRMANVFYAPGASDLIWDADLNFDGIAATVKKDCEKWTPFLTAAYFLIDKTPSTTPTEVTQQSVSGGTKYDFGDQQLSLGVGFHTFPGLKGHSGLATSTSGNSSTGSTYTYDYNLLNVGTEFQMKASERPLSVFVDYVKNSEPTEYNDGYLAGVKYGDTKSPGEWVVFYDYRELKKDASIGAFSDGDSWQGGTNGRGHRVGAGLSVMENSVVNVTYYAGEKGLTTSDTLLKRNKLHLDFALKF